MRKRWNAELIPYAEIEALDDTEPLCVTLTARKVALLLSQTQYLSWRTRYVHDGSLSKDEITAWAAGVEAALLNYTCPEEECEPPMMRGVEEGDCTLIQWRATSEDSWVTLATVCNGEDGAPGEPGAPGTPGEPGAPGEDCDCTPPEFPPPDVEPSSTVACGAATYMAEYALSLLNDMLDHLDAEADVLQAVTGWLSGIPGVNFPAEFVEWAIEIQEATTELVRAEMTETFDEQVICDLFCLMPETADVSEEIITAWAALVQTHVLSPLAGYELARLIVLLPLTEWRKRASIGAEVPSEACETLCECEESSCEPCDGAKLSVCYLDSDGGAFNVSGSSAVWTEGVGWTLPSGFGWIRQPITTLAGEANWGYKITKSGAINSDVGSDQIWYRDYQFTGGLYTGFGGNDVAFAPSGGGEGYWMEIYWEGSGAITQMCHYISEPPDYPEP